PNRMISRLAASHAIAGPSRGEGLSSGSSSVHVVPLNPHVSPITDGAQHPPNSRTRFPGPSNAIPMFQRRRGRDSVFSLSHRVPSHVQVSRRAHVVSKHDTAPPNAATRLPALSYAIPMAVRVVGPPTCPWSVQSFPSQVQVASFTWPGEDAMKTRSPLTTSYTSPRD